MSTDSNLIAQPGSPPPGRETSGPDADALLDLLPSAVLCLDADFRITYANATAHALSRIPAEPVAGRTLMDLYPDDEGTVLVETCRAVLSTGVPQRLEHFHQPFDVWLALLISPYAGGLLLHYDDITLRKETEAERDSATDRMRQAFEALPDGVVTINREWKFTYANSRALELVNHPNIVGRNIFELFPGNDQPPFSTSYRKTMAERTPTEFEAFHPEPLNLWLKVQANPHGDGMILFFSNISERKLSEIREHETARRLAEMLEVTSDAVVSLDREWRYTFLNQHAKRLIDRDDQLLGKNIWEVFTEAVGGPAWEIYHRSMNEGVTASAEIFYPEPINSWLALQSHPTPEGIVVFFRDITEEKLHNELVASQQALLKTVQHNARLATWNVDLVHRTISFGAGSYPVYGHPTESITTLNQFYTILHPDDRLSVRDTVLNAIAKREPFNQDFRVISATGETIWIEGRGTAQFENGTPTHLSGIALDATERHSREDVVREQQELLSTVQEASHIATYDIDLQAGTISYGTNSYELYGWPLGELTTRDRFRSIMSPQHFDEGTAALARAVNSLQVETNEVAVTAPDGRTIWVESRFQAVPAAGGVRHIRGIAIDITERKRNEAVLVTSEQRYRVLADLNPQAIWAASPSGALTYANPGLLDYIGCTLEELSGDEWIAGFAAADRDRVLATWAQSLAGGVDYDIDVRIIRASDHAVRWWNLRALPVRGEQGEIISWLGVGQDIHDARTAAEALRMEQQETERKRLELETVYRTAPIGLSLVDPVEFRFLRLNEREAEILGRPEGEILGRTVHEILPIPGVVELFEEVARGNPVRDHLLEGVLPTRPGEHRYWTVNYYPVFGPTGTVEAISTAAMEITNQKRSEAALIQSEKLAAVGRLASSISHEINNPLEAVTNLLYLVLVSSDLSADHRLYLQMAQSELSRVSQIATQTLRFHRQAVAPTLVTAGELVGAVLNLYQGRLANSGIRVDARYDSQVPILCFENDIRQVLNNLIANAIDAMRTGGRLVLRAHSTHGTQGEDGVRITIADTGHGMPPEVSRRIFEPFFTTKDLNGTGLGLWISAGIVDRHQGRLDVRSTTDPKHHGTVFTLFLPLKEEILQSA